MKISADRKNKHLTIDERIQIQHMLHSNETFKTIADSIGKDPGTVSKEVRRHIHLVDSTFVVKSDAGLISELCDRLTRAPYVCNGCKKRNFCHMEKHIYNAKYAQKEYEQLLVQAREGIPLSKESFYEMDRIISDGVKNGQHIYHIVETNDLDVSVSTVYRHLDKGWLSISAMDLPRKVKFKPRKSSHQQYVPHGVRIGRSYEDFLEFIDAAGLSSWMEMDTLVGEIGGKAIMTWDFTLCNFMVGFLLESKTAVCVSEVFKNIRSVFNAAGISFGDMIPLILTDNGSEFSNVDAIENHEDDDNGTSLFFCRPMRSCDKPHVEKNHTLFRDICPKGTSFNDLTQKDVDIIFSHVNSVARKSLHGRSPYEVFEFTYGKKITSLFGIDKIPPGEVIQSPSLLKKLK